MSSLPVPRLAAKQHRGLRAARPCSTIAEDLLHRVGVADDVGQRVAPAQLAAHAVALGDLVTVGPVEPHGVRDDRRDDLEHAHVLVERDALVEHAIRRERAEHLAAQLDRHADERDVGLVGARAGAVQEQRLFADVGHDHRLAARDDAAHDALAGAVDAAGDLGAREAVARRRCAVSRVSGSTSATVPRFSPSCSARMRIARRRLRSTSKLDTSVWRPAAAPRVRRLRRGWMWGAVDSMSPVKHAAVSALFRPESDLHWGRLRFGSPRPKRAENQTDRPPLGRSARDRY